MNSIPQIFSPRELKCIGSGFIIREKSSVIDANPAGR
jgi:hypothetical protein